MSTLSLHLCCMSSHFTLLCFYTRWLELMWEASCPGNNFCFCFKSFHARSSAKKTLPHCLVLLRSGPLSLFLLLSLSIWVFDALDLEKWKLVSLQSLVIIDWHCESHLDSCQLTFTLFHDHPWSTLCLPEFSVRCHLSVQKSVFCVSVYTHL